MKKNDTLLIVEDEENILYGMQSVLSCHLDFISEVYTARNGKEALTIIQNKPVSMIVTDLRMPEMDGTTMIKNIRKMGYQMPVIVLTAIADFKKAQELIPLKIQNYVLKPFSVEDILKEIDNAFCELREKESLKKAEKLLEKFPELSMEQEYKGKNPLIREAQKYISKHRKESISLQMLSEQLHVSKAYLSTLFKHEMDMTLTEFITKQKVKLAKRYLLDTDLRICEIAEETVGKVINILYRYLKNRKGLHRSLSVKDGKTGLLKKGRIKSPLYLLGVETG